MARRNRRDSERARILEIIGDNGGATFGTIWEESRLNWVEVALLLSSVGELDREDRHWKLSRN